MSSQDFVVASVVGGLVVAVVRAVGGTVVDAWVDVAWVDLVWFPGTRTCACPRNPVPKSSAFAPGACAGVGAHDATQVCWSTRDRHETTAKRNRSVAGPGDELAAVTEA
jgi:hypothetical protein